MGEVVVGAKLQKKDPASAVESGVSENHHSQVGASVRPPKASQQVTGSRCIVLWFNTSEIQSNSAGLDLL
jgi:hypothetical protein